MSTNPTRGRHFDTLKLGDLPAFKKLYAKLTKDRVHAVGRALEEADKCIERGELTLADLSEEPDQA